MDQEHHRLDAKVPQLFIDISRACNLRCVMCDIFSADASADYSKGNWKGPRLMDFDLFKRIVDQASPFVDVFCPQGAGEPLMHPRFVDMVAYIRERKPSANIWFNTNGQLLSRETTDKLLAIGVDHISFSVDAASPDVYEGIRVGGDYGRLVENIKYLLKARSRRGVPIRTKATVTFVLQERNESQKKAFLRYWLPKVEQVVFYKKVELDRRRPSMFFKPKAQSRRVCESLWTMAAVSIDGVGVPCCGDPGREEPLGDVSRTDLADIIGCGRHRQLRETQIGGDFTLSALCSKCRNWLSYGNSYVARIPSKKLVLTRNPFSECWQLERRK